MICATSHKAIVDQYIDDVLSGKQVACKLVIAACRRQLRDLERQNTEGFPYYFDAKEADEVCNFFPLALRHSKGAKFAGMPFELQPWQVFTKWVLFGWKRCADDTRRFRRAHISIARKNGKSTDAAGLGLYGLTCDGEPGAEVYVSATKKDQAKCVFEEAERMREASPALSRLIKSHVNNLFIDAPGLHGFFRPTSSDKPLDGPNPHFVIFDELHAWKEVHRKFYNTMVTGGGARTQPLQLTITTAGDDKSLIWLEEYKHCKGVVLGDFEDDSIFVYIAEIDDDDDPLDESCWIKANPNLGVSVSMDYMRQQAKDAVNKPSFYSVFVSKHCNKITSSTEKAFEMPLWDACRGDLSDWSQADAIGCGIDLGGRDDLAAYALVARFRDGGEDESPVWRYEAQIRAYIAENTTRDLTKQPFAQFVYDEQIKVVRFPVNSLRDDMLEECAELGIPMAGYDPYNGQQLGEEITAAGMQSVRVSQTYGMYNEPIRDLQACIKDRRFTYDGSPLLRWCANNAVIIKDNKDHWMYDKSKSSDKIDPIVAMTMAFRLAMLAPARATGSLYL